MCILTLEMHCLALKQIKLSIPSGQRHQLIVFVLRLLAQTSKVNNKNQNGLFQWKHTNYMLLQAICGKICRGQHPEVASITGVLCQYNCFTSCHLNKQVHPRFGKPLERR